MKKIALLLTVVTVAGAFIFYFGGFRVTNKERNEKIEQFAKCLASKEITMYGAYWCSHCQREKAAFGEAFKFVPYVECTKEPAKCSAKGITGFPTWVIPADKEATNSSERLLVGEQGLKKLSEETSCPL